MAIGFRDPHTYRKLPLVPALALTNRVLEVERLVREHRNSDLHQLLFDLSENGL